MSNSDFAFKRAIKLREGISKVIDIESENHMHEFFKRGDLPGPGAVHNQIYAAGYENGLQHGLVLREAIEEIKWSCEYDMARGVHDICQRALTMFDSKFVGR